jgi:hypothetical protein
MLKCIWLIDQANALIGIYPVEGRRGAARAGDHAKWWIESNRTQ